MQEKQTLQTALFRLSERNKNCLSNEEFRKSILQSFSLFLTSAFS